MRRLRAALPVMMAVIATWCVTTATTAAQSSVPAWVFVRDTFGQTWLVVGGSKRVAVPIYPVTDEELQTTTWTGTWVVPNAAGTGVSEGARPSWDTSAAPAGATSGAVQPPAATSSSEDPVKLGGDRGQNTKPFDLKGGAYTVKWETKLNRDSSSCYSSATLYRVQGKEYVESLYSVLLDRNGDRSASGETQVYGLKPGQYYVDANTSACSWSVEISPQ